MAEVTLQTQRLTTGLKDFWTGIPAARDPVSTIALPAGISQ